MKPAPLIITSVVVMGLVGAICGAAWFAPKPAAQNLASGSPTSGGSATAAGAMTPGAGSGRHRSDLDGTTVFNAALRGGALGGAVGAVAGLALGLVGLRLFGPEPPAEDVLVRIQHLLRYCPRCKKAYDKSRATCSHCGEPNPTRAATAAKQTKPA